MYKYFEKIGFEKIASIQMQIAANAREFVCSTGVEPKKF